MMLNPRRRLIPFAPALLLFMAIVPAGFTGVLILKYGVDVPFSDEWNLVPFFEKFAQGTLSFRDLFAQQNEYRQFFPNLIFVALGWLTKWDVRYETLVSFLLACLVSFNAYHLGKLTLDASREQRRWAYLITNLLIFSPVQHENWLQGQQIIFFIPIACVTTCMLVAYSASLRTGTKFLICAGLSTISTFSSANGLLCWAVVLPALVWPWSWEELSGKKWWILGWIMGLALNSALYFYDYQKPSPHPEPSEALFHPAQAGIYFLSILGRPLGLGRIAITVAIGSILIILFAWTWLGFRKSLEDSAAARRMIGWLMIGTYSVLTATLITIGRSGFGVEQSLTSRYTTFTLYLTVSLVHLLPTILSKASQRGDLFKNRFAITRLAPLLAVALIFLHLTIYFLGIRQMSSFRIILLQSKVCVQFANVIRDECLTKQGYSDLDAFKQLINAADRLDFLRPGLVKSNRVYEIAETDAQDSSSYGSFQTLVYIGGDEYVASGWAVLPHRDEPADAVLLVYEQADNGAIIFAIAELERERDIASAVLRRGVYGDARWRRSFTFREIPSSPVQLTAWSFDAYTGKAYRLNGAHATQKSVDSGRP